MCLSIPDKPGSASHSSTSTASTGLLHLLVGAPVHFGLEEAANQRAATHQRPTRITKT